MKNLIITGALLLLPFGSLYAASDYYLKLGGVKGESTSVASASLTVSGNLTVESGKMTVGSTVVLDATQSADDGTITRFLWKQVSGPVVKLANAATAKASFTPAHVGTYVFELSVTDASGMTKVARRVEAIIIGDPDFDLLNVSSSPDDGAKGGNVEFEWKVEEGQKGGTEDLNIGVGELQESPTGGAGAGKVSMNDTSLQGGVSVAAGDVNGLTEEEKQTFLASVKTHAEVQSEQDLNNFAKGILIEDTNMEEISFNYEKITFKYRSSGKLFGFMRLSFTQAVEIDTEGDDMGRVKVKMPWYSFLLKADVSAQALENEIRTNEKLMEGNNENWDFGAHAELLSSISNVLKTKHDTVKNSINNAR